MNNRIAVILTNYNMPERTDALCAHLLAFSEWPLSLFVVDNGSDMMPPSKYTTLHLEQNCQTTGGWLAGLRQAQGGDEWLGYLFLITSAEFGGEHDPIAPMAKVLLGNSNAVGIHPALTEDSTTAWGHLKTRGGDGSRRTWMIDNICSLYRASWFDGIGGFDPRLIYGWGVDLETCWKARMEHRSLWVCEDARVKKVTDIGYAMQRMNMSAEERRKRAGENMRAVLSVRYGENWWYRMTTENVGGLK